MYNEVLELQELALQRKLKRKSHFSDEQKRMIVREHLVNGVSQTQLAKDFGIRRESIWKWISIFAQGNEPTSKRKAVRSKAEEQLNSTPMPRKKQNPAESPEEELARLRAENKRLQEALKMAEWSNHAKDKMIEIAEQTFNIPIRKKSGAKQ